MINDPDAHDYLSLVGVMYPEIDNKIIENEIQLFIENQDIVKEIDKLDELFYSFNDFKSSK